MANKTEFMESVQNSFYRIAEDLKENLIAARVFEMEEGMPGPVLTVIYDDMGADADEVLADYTVIVGEDEEDAVAYVESFLTFTEELSGENLPLVYEAISKINFYLPYGGFAVNEDTNVLGFKFGMPISMELSEEALYEAINLCVTGGYLQADNYVFPLLQISEGNMSIDEVLELIRGVKED